MDEETKQYTLDIIAGTHERTMKRFIIFAAIVLIAAFATIGAALAVAFDANRKAAELNRQWLEAWASYDYVSTEIIETYQQDGEGINIIGSRNGVEYDGTE